MISRRNASSIALVVAIMATTEAAQAASTWLESSKRFTNRAVSIVQKAMEPGADAKQLGRQALNSLNVAKMLLEKYDEPRPAEAAEALDDIAALMHWTNRRLLDDPPARPTGTRSELGEAAQALLDKATRYERAHGDNATVVTARFYEVADKYPTTPSAAVAARGRGFDIEKDLVDEGVAPDERPGTTRTNGDTFAEFRRVISSGSPDSRRVDACTDLLARLEIDDPARAELVALRSVFSAATASEKKDALRAYRDAFAKGLFADAIPKTAQRSNEPADLADLKRDLASIVEKQKKLDVCGEFLRKHPDSASAAEIKALQKAFDAKYESDESAAWLEYLTTFPSGFASAQVLVSLAQAEPWFMLQVKGAISQSDSERVSVLAKIHAEAFPKSANKAEMRSARAVMNADGPERMRLAEAHAREFAQGYLAAAFSDMIAQMRQSRASSAVKKLLSRYSAAQTDASRVDACNDYLAKYSDTPEADEVKLARLMTAGATSKARHAAIRRYLEKHPDGLFATAAREFLRVYTAELEEDAYKDLQALLAEGKADLAARLNACRKYLEEFPEGAHYAEVSKVADSIDTLAASEETAFQALLLELPLVASLTEAAQVCDAYLTTYAGGEHFKEVLARKSEYVQRIALKNEAAAYAQLMDRVRGAEGSRVEKAEACVAYLRQFEHGTYSREVRRELRRFASLALGPHQGPVYAAAFTSDSKHLVTSDADSSTDASGLWVWELPDGALRRRWTPKPSFTATAIAATSPETMLVGELLGGLSTWNILEGTVARRLRIGRKATVSVSPCIRSGVVATASLSGASARLWTLPRLEISRSYPCRGRVTAVATSPEGDLVAVGTASGRLAVFRTDGSTPEWVEPKAHTGPIEQVAFSPRGSPLISVCPTEGVVCAWGSLSGTESWCVEDPTTSIAFVDPLTLATTSAVRSSRDGSSLFELRGVSPLAASADGRFLLVGSQDNMATLWYLPALLQK